MSRIDLTVAELLNHLGKKATAIDVKYDDIYQRLGRQYFHSKAECHITNSTIAEIQRMRDEQERLSQLIQTIDREAQKVPDETAQ